MTIEGCQASIRLALVDTPENYEAGYGESNAFTASLCKVGSTATIDQDDLQPYDKYGRIIALVYCQNKKLNAELLANNLAVINTQFCPTSEFRNAEWAKEHCITPTTGCDPSYPTVCIPPSPPDLDCGDIPHKNFKVVSPDPHRFDGDKDGIGCEITTTE